MSAHELRYLVSRASDPDRVRQDRRHLTSIVETALLDEALSREARVRDPRADLYARVAERRAGIKLLLSQELKVTDEEVKSFYEAQQSRFTKPERVRLSYIKVESCPAATAVKLVVEDKSLSFAAAKLKHGKGHDPRLPATPTEWRTVETVPPPVRRALEAVKQPGELTAPVQLGDGCLLVRLEAREAARTPSFAAVRQAARQQLLARRQNEVRRQLLARLDESQLEIQTRTLKQILAGNKEIADSDPVVIGGGERILAGEVRVTTTSTGVVGPGGGAGRRGLGVRLRGDLALWLEARRRGLDKHPAVRLAARSALAQRFRDLAAAEVTSAQIAETELRQVYEKAKGDYTEPERVKVAALITRDRRKAEQWAEELRKSKFRADAFAKLLPKSEDPGSRQRQGDLGWIDARSTQYPESFRKAALMLPRPGASSGALLSRGVYHVLLCRDRTPSRVKPFEEVRDEIASSRLQRLRHQRVRQAVAKVKEGFQPQIDWQAIKKIDWQAPVE